jgi:hypothetical protein
LGTHLRYAPRGLLARKKSTALTFRPHPRLETQPNITARHYDEKLTARSKCELTLARAAATRYLPLGPKVFFPPPAFLDRLTGHDLPGLPRFSAGKGEFFCLCFVEGGGFVGVIMRRYVLGFVLALTPFVMGFAGEGGEILSDLDGVGLARSGSNVAGLGVFGDAGLGPGGAWYWNGVSGGCVVQPLMALDGWGRLGFFHPENPDEPVILIDPSGVSPAIWVGERRVLLEGSELGIPVLGDSALGVGGALGDGALAAAASGITLGSGAVASSYGQIAVGVLSVASGTNSLAIGRWASSEAIDTIAIGVGTQALLGTSVAIGAYALAENNCAISVGYNSVANGLYSVAVGTAAKAHAFHSAALGGGAVAGADHALALSTSAQALQTDAVAIGHSAQAKSFQSMAVGSGAFAEGDCALALGLAARALQRNAVAIGTTARATKDRQVALGAYNEPEDVAGMLFTLGNGTSTTARSNAIAVSREGKTTVIHKNYVAPTTQVPSPAQPDAFEARGNAIIHGKIILKQPAGDISMGGFTAQ